MKADGSLKDLESNASIILVNDPEWRGILTSDDFADEVFFDRPVPDLPGAIPPRPGERLRDHHLHYLLAWFAKRRNMKLSAEAMQRAAVTAAHGHRVHPLRLP